MNHLAWGVETEDKVSLHYQILKILPLCLNGFRYRLEQAAYYMSVIIIKYENS